MSQTNFMYVSTNKSRLRVYPTIVIDNTIITQTNSLRLHIDKHAGWEIHIKHILGKVSSGIYALSRFSKVCNLKTLKIIHFALIHSHTS